MLPLLFALALWREVLRRLRGRRSRYKQEARMCWRRMQSPTVPLRLWEGNASSTQSSRFPKSIPRRSMWMWRRPLQRQQRSSTQLLQRRYQTHSQNLRNRHRGRPERSDHCQRGAAHLYITCSNIHPRHQHGRSKKPSRQSKHPAQSRHRPTVSAASSTTSSSLLQQQQQRRNRSSAIHHSLQPSTQMTMRRGMRSGRRNLRICKTCFRPP